MYEMLFLIYLYNNNKLASCVLIFILFKIYSEIFMLYRLSYLWYTLVGATVSMIIALITSFIFQPLNPKDVNPELLAPFVKRLIKPRNYPNQPNGEEIIFAYERTVSFTLFPRLFL